MLVHRAAAEARLRQAFEADELRVYYQPQISLASGGMLIELSRWTKASAS